MPLNAVWQRLLDELSRLPELGSVDLVFGRRDAALRLLLVIAGLGLALLVVRTAIPSRGARRRQVSVPAILGRGGGSWVSGVRHLPLLLWLTGVAAFAIALADPYVTLAEDEVSHPGRRIALLIDASSSMLAPFPSQQLGAKAPNEAAFFTTVAAAQSFIRQRKDGRYQDLVALIEFGDEAYVVTPFTTDYDNVLLSASLIGDWGEFMHFPNQGTTIGTAIERAIGLFRAFDFADASGNLMVIFSDGQDTQVQIGNTPVNAILAQAVRYKIPVYLVRTSRGKLLGDIVPDSIWKPAVESTGGRFYAAANEGDVVKAIQDIDRRSPGAIRVKRYSTNQPRFAPFAVAATGAWTVALVLQLLLPIMRTFP